MASPLHHQHSTQNYFVAHGGPQTPPPRLAAAAAAAAAPSSSPGTAQTGIPSPSKHTRRLQLRNAGFRGATLPTRKVTPMSLSSSPTTNWSFLGGMQPSSDAENVSPLSGKRVVAEGSSGRGLLVSGSKRDSITSYPKTRDGVSYNTPDILQDIGNANAANNRQANAKRNRATPTTSKFWPATADIAQPPPPPPPPPQQQQQQHQQQQQTTNIHQRPVRISRAKMARPRRSVSTETRKYVDHLEQQLSDAQAQISAINSPTVTRETSSKIRRLNAETKQLKEEVAAWESKYEERLQEELDKHYQVEASLRARIRTLEEESEEASFRIHELEFQRDTTMQNIEAVEGSNVNLEKRLEILSELLAANQSNIDLHAETPGRRRQSRPKPMLPRFPTAGSLATSPEQHWSRMYAASPTRCTTRLSLSTRPLSISGPILFPDIGSDDGDGSNGSDTNSVIVAPPTARKPARRMRRFGAGSFGPKPLILSSTSSSEHAPASASPLERDDVPSGFPSNPCAGVTVNGTKRRASGEHSPFLPVPLPLTQPFSLDLENIHLDYENDDICPDWPSSKALSNMSRDFSSMSSTIGPTTGRNLMDELTAVQASDIGLSDDQTEKTQIHISDDSLVESSPFYPDAEDAEDDPKVSLPNTSQPHHILPPETIASRFASGLSTAVAPSTAYGRLRITDLPELSRCSSNFSVSVQSNRSISALHSLQLLFSELFRSPVELARHLVQRAQSRLRIPRPLLNVQWWLFGVLFAPMTRYRMRSQPKPSSDHVSSEQSALLSGETEAHDDALSYGELYQTPRPSPLPPVRTRSLVAGTGKKRDSSEMAAKSSVSSFVSDADSSSPCPHNSRRLKHSPWLWLKFSMTLAIAIGVAFKDGPSSLLLHDAVCHCRSHAARLDSRRTNWRRTRRDHLLITP